MKHGDFSTLADNYAKFRPKYSDIVRDTILSMTHKPLTDVKFADVGAGTGLWTRMIAEKGCQTLAIEPNDNMRTNGEKQNGSLDIDWKKGSGEATGIDSDSLDLITMASSFHWTKFDVSTREFARVLKEKGLFVALWNPRLIEVNPLLVQIENKLKELVPNLKRVSSGRADFTKNLYQNLQSSPYFKDVLYLEGRHVEKQTPEHYIGLWESVNDIKVQAGEKIFKEFLSYIKNKIKDLEFIEATYLTRAWAARKS
jgi:ubiquinone/menaquinone biosynthesis C-methylase UbiE